MVKAVDIDLFKVTFCDCTRIFRLFALRQRHVNNVFNLGSLDKFHCKDIGRAVVRINLRHCNVFNTL